MTPEVEAMVERTVATFGRLDAAYNIAGVQNAVAEAAEATRGGLRSRDFGQSARRVELHEVRASPDAQAGKWRHRQLLFDWRTGGRSQTRNIPSLQAWRAWARQKCRTGLCIRINAVCPGIIHTSMLDRMMATQADALNAMLKDVPIGRLGRPEEIASAVLWLCSSAASFMVGHALAVDGGYTIR
jgi:NAD(P)-dependent dehydrogenase (short-subunit alcohol dehydrogenase family)